MPGKSRNKSRKPRRKTRMVRYQRQPLVAAGFQHRKIVKLRYSDYATLSSDNTGVQTYAFSVNSLYDPNRTGTGHQPMFYDTYAGIYNHYRVLGSKITCKWTNTTVQTGSIVGVRIDDDANTFTGDAIDRMIELNDSKYQIVVGQNAPKTVTMKWSAKKFGVKNDDSWTAQVGANPADEQFFVIYAAPALRSATLGTVVCNVLIEYIVEFFELITQPQS